MTRRKIKIMVIVGAIILLASVGYGFFFCARNERIENEWSEWTSHLSGPPSSWQVPSSDLQRFYASTLNGKGELYGYKNNEGDVVIKPRFSPCAERFYDGLAWVWDPIERRSGYIHPDGSWAIVVDGTTHSDFVGGMGEFQIIGKDGYPMHGFVNRQGKVVVPAKYRTTAWYVNGYVLVHERTWIGKLADYIGKEVGVFPKTCLETRSIILDKTGRVTSLPSQ